MRPAFRALALAATTCAALALGLFIVLHDNDELATFDYIVVGGGSTGSIVAGRLGQAGYTVLVLEAGGTTQNSLGGTQGVAGKWTIFDIPLGWVQVLSDHRWSKEFQWEVPSDPPPAIARGLGGCGIHNAMLYMRGRPEDFEAWGAGWGWADVLPYYIRSEDNQRHTKSELHGVGGPVAVSDVKSDNISRAFVESCVASGVDANDDFNGARREGAGFYQFLIRGGVRDAPAAAFLGFGNRPSTVSVVTHSLVSRVLFEGNRAWGVEYVRGTNPNGGAARLKAAARKEVVLCAGAINTPKLLQLSGVGDRPMLDNFGIPTVYHNPSVGSSAADGVYAIMQWASVGGDFVRCRIDSLGGSEDNDYCSDQLKRWAAGDADSVFASPGVSAGAFLRSPYAQGGEPDIQLTIHPWDKYGRTWTSSYQGFATMEIANNHPRSRGRVALRSGRFSDPPIFEGVYLSNINDSLALLWAIREVRKIAKLPPLRDILRAELIPGALLTSDKDLLDAIQCGPKQFRSLGRPACDRTELPVNHLAGTCRLGDPTDSRAVVDHRLRVIGVRGLRVADASVMPRPPSGNTHATCMMIGERAAQMIIDDDRGVRRALQRKRSKRRYES